MDVEITEGTDELSAVPLPSATEHQLKALEAAIKQNTIVILETDSEKTLMAIMLLRRYANLLRKPSPFFAVFLFPTDVLVQQQSEALMMHTDLKVGKYRGGNGVASDAASWRKKVDEHEVLVMTPAILLAALRHGFLKIDMIKVLIFDECQHARGKHPYACIMREFYHQELNSKNSNLPRIFGMTASPIKAKVRCSDTDWQEIQKLENLMHSKIAALTDNLVPDIVEEKQEAQKNGSMGIGIGKYIDEQVKYVPPELVGCASNDPRALYHCYLIELEPDYNYDIKTHDIMLALRTKLEFENETLSFNLDVDKGSLMITLRYHEDIVLNPEQVLLCQEFQLTALRVLIDQTLDKQHGVLGESGLRGECAVFNYLLLPTTGSHQNPLINWECVNSVRFPWGSDEHVDCSQERCHGRLLHTFMDPVCSCMLENCLVVTPHNGFLYCISRILDTLDGNSLMKDGKSITYRSYFERRHNITLRAVEQPLLSGKRVFSVKNYLHRCRIRKTKESSNTSVELPPELCHVIMSPISVASFYTFSYAPSIMHRVESLLLAANLKGILVDHCMQNVVIPTVEVLEAITTKHCQENFNLDSLATFGDSFLKYAVSQQLFKTYQDDHEGLLSNKREKIISNASLCKLGCDCKIQGFIRNEPFDPKAWIIPGDNAGAFTLDGELVSSRRIFYSRGRRRIKIKRVADVVEALIGAFLGSGGELAALSFIKWLGIEVDFIHRPYTMPIQLCPRKLVDVKFLESLFNYKFHDASLLVEALTHGSSMVPEIPRCYQRLEFLGDAVLDYLITKYLYRENPGLLPGLLTDLRSALVNNECYAQSAIKAGLHKHIRSSQELQKQIATSVQIFEKSSVSTSVWESETILPKVLGDIIESLAGAIFLDSGYCKEIVFDSIRPLLQPMITPETLKLHPVRELTELCQKEHYVMSVTRCNGTTTVEVAANGVIHKHSSSVTNKRTAKRLACNAVLKSLKKSVSSTQMFEKLVHVCSRSLSLFLFLFYLYFIFLFLFYLYLSVESWNIFRSFS